MKISKLLILLTLSSLAACNNAAKREPSARGYEFPPSILSSSAARNSAAKPEFNARNYKSQPPTTEAHNTQPDVLHDRFPPSTEEVKNARIGSLVGNTDGIVLYEKSPPPTTKVPNAQIATLNQKSPLTTEVSKAQETNNPDNNGGMVLYEGNKQTN